MKSWLSASIPLQWLQSLACMLIDKSMAHSSTNCVTCFLIDYYLQYNITVENAVTNGHDMSSSLTDVGETSFNINNICFIWQLIQKSCTILSKNVTLNGLIGLKVRLTKVLRDIVTMNSSRRGSSSHFDLSHQRMSLSLMLFLMSSVMSTTLVKEGNNSSEASSSSSSGKSSVRVQVCQRFSQSWFINYWLLFSRIMDVDHNVLSLEKPFKILYALSSCWSDRCYSWNIFPKEWEQWHKWLEWHQRWHQIERLIERHSPSSCFSSQGCFTRDMGWTEEATTTVDKTLGRRCLWHQEWNEGVVRDRHHFLETPWPLWEDE